MPTFETKVGPITWRYAVDETGLQVDGPLKHLRISWSAVRGAAVGRTPEAGDLGSQLLLSVQEPGQAKPKLHRFPLHTGRPEAVLLAQAVAAALGPRWLGLGDLNGMAKQLGHSQAWATVAAVVLVAAVTAAVIAYALANS